MTLISLSSIREYNQILKAGFNIDLAFFISILEPSNTL